MSLLNSTSLTYSQVKRRLTRQLYQKRLKNSSVESLLTSEASDRLLAITEIPRCISALREVRKTHQAVVSAAMQQISQLRAQNEDATRRGYYRAEQALSELDAQIEELLAQATEYSERIQKNEDIIRYMTYRLGRASGSQPTLEKGTQTWQYQSTPRYVAYQVESKNY